ncbi:hypothetical protein PR202_gb26406 [Eleusine coracana subsp. coracana]|uniref:Uncharacterized protein n=1 Tax=Eleusine coracana subsp. coracana TaxID=191504 RepID=A0AAV5FSH7_ELECO|nr:hypothetical protein PR202_gb26406 [Eleusine coracana subsp. coracana]
MTSQVFYTGPTNLAESAASTAGSGERGGFVQGVVTYTVTDDLAVTPMSTISSITLLNSFAVRDLGDLQEKTVHIGYDELNASMCIHAVYLQGVEILKASMHSKQVFTDVFLLGKKQALPVTRVWLMIRILENEKPDAGLNQSALMICSPLLV